MKNIQVLRLLHVTMAVQPRVKGNRASQITILTVNREPLVLECST